MGDDDNALELPASSLTVAPNDVERFAIRGLARHARTMTKLRLKFLLKEPMQDVVRERLAELEAETGEFIGYFPPIPTDAGRD